MAVYVDIAIWERRDRRWCHLLADDPVELHRFAARLGIERRRFQHKPGRPRVGHDDIDEPHRRAAIGRGAVEVTRHEVVELIARKRTAALAGRARTAPDYAAGTTASPTVTTPPSSTSP